MVILKKYIQDIRLLKPIMREGKMSDIFDSINIQLQENAFRAQFLSGLMMPLMDFYW